jgi:hypothetical protein
MSFRKYFTIAVLLTGLVANVQAANQWLHVNVDSEKEEKVRVNLPMSAVSAALPILQSQHLAEAGISEGKIRLDNTELKISDLREIWKALKAEGTFELANVVSTDANVSVVLENDYLRIKTEETEGDHVNVQIPVNVVDALLSGEGEELNLMAAVEALSQLENQELVLVEADDAVARVWIDDSAK